MGDCPPGVSCENPLPNMQVRQNRASNLGPGNVRVNPDGSVRPHHGHDLHAPTGTQVSSSMAGTVVSATNAGSNGYGNTVVVKSNITPQPSELPAGLLGQLNHIPGYQKTMYMFSTVTWKE